MRAFLAVELSRQSRELVAKFQARWIASVPSARWVRSENLHLTLRFLGDVEPDVASALVDSLRRVANGASAFTYSLRGGGCFPSPRRARILWVGVQPVSDELNRLQHGVEAAVQEHGFSPEERGFKAHLTIARLKTPERAVSDVVAALEAEEFGATSVSELVLFESRLSPRGASYRAVERFRLGGPVVEQLV